MKKLYFIGGTMGVGKTTVCQLLKKQLSPSVFLDGDWCWDMYPFQVVPETKAMVLDNIKYLLNNFIHCSHCEHVIFCWVMHEQGIIDDILSGLDLDQVEVKNISLICNEVKLRERLQIDVDRNVRESEVIERSIKRLKCYQSLDTLKLDVSEMSAEEVAEWIAVL